LAAALLLAKIKEKPSYESFKYKYRDDPAAFMLDCIEWGDKEPASYQLEAASDLVQYGREAIRGPHGLGKTALAAWVVHWFALTRDGVDDWKIPTTASAWRQLTKYLWPEIHKWARKLKWDVIGREPYNERTELLSRSLKLKTGEAFALASNQSDLIEGAHAEQLLYLFDEAKTIPDETWNSAEGAFSTGDCYWLAISTPGEPQGKFYNIHTRKRGNEDWNARHVTLTDSIKAGRINESWADQRRLDWGEESAVFQNRVLGEFAVSEEDSVIPLAHIEMAIERWFEWDEADKPGDCNVFGVDVGRGGDKSVYALRFDDAIDTLRRDNSKDTMQVTGKVIGIFRANPSAKAVIDVIGVGAGVVDRARELGYQVDAFSAGASASGKTDKSGELQFADIRSAAWWNLRELLAPDSGREIALPPDDLLIGDLTAPKWRVVSGGKIKVESKDKIRERIGRSTDSADAVIQAFYEDASWWITY